MTKNELWRLLQNKEEEFSKNKTKRFVYTVLFYSVLLFVVFVLQGRLKNLDLINIVGEFVICVFLSCLFTLLNSVVFKQLFNMSETEERYLIAIRRKIQEKEENGEE